RSNVVIKKNIGQIFKQCNVVEYKSPDDRFTIWDYHKTQCYSRLYASQHKISVDEMTVTAVMLKTPRKLLRELGKHFDITNSAGGCAAGTRYCHCRCRLYNNLMERIAWHPAFVKNEQCRMNS
ncbi:MAG: hypothetical protein LBT89_02350, partial [Planctomycetaceae bacterium]|nr:hypothetical protein [Planctomycetaceae bacterium]